MTGLHWLLVFCVELPLVIAAIYCAGRLFDWLADRLGWGDR
jgi:hypothetical protein